MRDAKRVHYALVDSDLDLVIATGATPVENGAATIDVTLRKGSVISRSHAVLYLSRSGRLTATTRVTSRTCGARSAFQQRLIAYLKGVRFGPGLRFLMDPIDTGAGLIGAENDLFPATEGYHAAFQEWLVHQSGFNDINIRWGLTQTHLPSLEVAARLVPTWPREDPPDGPAWLVDPLDNLAFQVIARRCHILVRLRCVPRRQPETGDEPGRGHGPGSGALRAGHLPWTGYQPLFDNVTGTNGYDGIAPALRGSGTGLAIAGGGRAFPGGARPDELVARCRPRHRT